MNVVRWVTPWPLIQVSGHEWVVIRDHPSRPAALVRYLPDKPAERYRVVRWAPDPIDRRLFEYFPTLEMADMSVTFMEREPDTGRPALTSERSPEWARFERWYWLQASDRLVNDFLPAWACKERLVRRPMQPTVVEPPSPSTKGVAITHGRSLAPPDRSVAALPRGAEPNASRPFAATAPPARFQ